MPARKKWLPLQRLNPSVYQNIRRKRRAYWLYKYKVARGCDRCGYNEHGVALDWDHIDRETKEFLPSSKNMGLSLKRIFKEIRKCQLLCANCHRIHTYTHRQFNNKHTKYVEIPEEYKALVYRN